MFAYVKSFLIILLKTYITYLYRYVCPLPTASNFMHFQFTTKFSATALDDGIAEEDGAGIKSTNECEAVACNTTK